MSCVLYAQQDIVLMRINGKDILRSEFEYIYNKNRTLAAVEQKTLQEYVELFVDFKLKVAAAEAEGIDNTNAFRKELEGYRRQLAKVYLTDEAALEIASQREYHSVEAARKEEQSKVRHIFKRLPQNATRHALRNAEQQMDSIYTALQNRQASFDVCVSQFSDEKSSFWVSRLQMPEEFERVISELQTGEYSSPFFTPQGIHIVKLIKRKQASTLEEIKSEINNRPSPRNEADNSAQLLVEKLKTEYKYTPNAAGIEELLSKGNTDKLLFVLGGKEYTGKMFEPFASSHPQSVKRQFDGFVMKSILDYEYANLDKKYPEFKLLMQEYRDGMLLFEISNREVWERALSDEAGMESYFDMHRQDYNWETPRYKGIVLHATSKRIGNQARKFLKSLPEEEWQDALRLTFNASEVQVKAEQATFAPGDNAFVDDKIFKVAKTKAMASYPFTYYLGKKVKGPHSYQEVRGQLVDDYQHYLEENWLAKLRSVFQVEINHEVLETVNNH